MERRPSRVPGFSVASLLLCALVPFLAVGGPAAPALAAAPATAPATAYVRVGHLVPGFGAVTMAATLSSFDGQSSPVTLTPSATYGVVGAYRAVPAGFYSLAVRPVGASPSSPPVLSGSLQAQPGAAYTVVGLGTATQPTVATITDDLAHPSPGTTRMRVINAAVPGQSASVSAGGDAVATGVQFATATEYQAAPAGSVTVSASVGDRRGSSSIDLVSGDVYTVLVLDDGHGGVAVRPVTDAAGAATVPVGGAATGRGGLARDTASARWTVAAAALAGSGAVGLVVASVVTGRRPGGRRRAIRARART